MPWEMLTSNGIVMKGIELAHCKEGPLLVWLSGFAFVHVSWHVFSACKDLCAHSAWQVLFERIVTSSTCLFITAWVYFWGLESELISGCSTFKCCKLLSIYATHIRCGGNCLYTVMWLKSFGRTLKQDVSSWPFTASQVTAFIQRNDKVFLPV